MSAKQEQVSLTRERQRSKCFRHMKIGLCRVCRLPGRIESLRLSAFDAKQVESPGHIRIKDWGHATHRNGQFRSPDMLPFVDSASSLYQAHEIGCSLRGNIQIEPAPVGADF